MAKRMMMLLRTQTLKHRLAFKMLEYQNHNDWLTFNLQGKKRNQIIYNSRLRSTRILPDTALHQPHNHRSPSLA